jgi:hypothetical protein
MDYELQDEHLLGGLVDHRCRRDRAGLDVRPSGGSDDAEERTG